MGFLSNFLIETTQFVSFEFITYLSINLGRFKAYKLGLKLQGCKSILMEKLIFIETISLQFEDC